MPRGPRLILDNALYHLIVRGNKKNPIFVEDLDYREYVKRIRLYKKRYDFKLYSYCLMPNHVHLLGEIEKKDNLAKFMQGINLSYAIYFNNRYETAGHTWQGRFVSRVIMKDRYLLDCINYIELNPVRADIVKIPSVYPWSSYKERNLDPVTECQLIDILSL